MLVFMTLAMLIGAPIMMMVGIIMAVRADVSLSWIIVVAVILLAIGAGLIVSRMGPLFKRQQKPTTSTESCVNKSPASA